MLTRTTRAEQWKVLRRLHSVGCPLDWDHVAVPSRPLRISLTSSIEGTNIFSVPGGTGIALGLLVFASAPVTIAEYMLEADWLNTPGSCIEPCSEHKGKYCFHECSLGHKGERIDAEFVLNRRRSSRQQPDVGTFRRGDSIEELLLATFPEVTPPTAAALLPATLWIEDRFGDSYPFRLLLDNKKTDLPARLGGEEKTQSSQ